MIKASLRSHLTLWFAGLSLLTLLSVGVYVGHIATEQRKQASGKSLEPREAPREALARKLRKLETVALGDIPGEGQEFALLVARRLPSGEVVVIGEVPDDVALLERAAKKLIG